MSDTEAWEDNVNEKAALRAEIRKAVRERDAEIERLQELLRGVGANRYWEGRWRDEKAEIERLRNWGSEEARKAFEAEKLVGHWYDTAQDEKARNAKLLAALRGMLDEWERLSRYGSPMAKAANPRVTAARAAIAEERH